MRAKTLRRYALLFIWSAALIYLPISLIAQAEIVPTCSDEDVNLYSYLYAFLPVVSSMAVLMLLIQISSSAAGYSYLRLGLKIGLLGPVSMFALFYPMLGYMQHGVLSGGEMLAEKSDYIFFSVVTITTLGYGDMLPCPSSRPYAAAHATVGILIVPVLVGWAFAIASRSTKPDP